MRLTNKRANTLFLIFFSLLMSSLWVVSVDKKELYQLRNSQLVIFYTNGWENILIYLFDIFLGLFILSILYVSVRPLVQSFLRRFFTIDYFINRIPGFYLVLLIHFALLINSYSQREVLIKISTKITITRCLMPLLIFFFAQMNELFGLSLIVPPFIVILAMWIIFIFSILFFLNGCFKVALKQGLLYNNYFQEPAVEHPFNYHILLSKWSIFSNMLNRTVINNFTASTESQLSQEQRNINRFLLAGTLIGVGFSGGLYFRQTEANEIARSNLEHNKTASAEKNHRIEVKAQIASDNKIASINYLEAASNNKIASINYLEAEKLKAANIERMKEQDKNS